MKLFSNPILLLVAGFFVFFIPRFARFLAAVSLVGTGLIGLYAKSDRFLESE
jgi:hypothetical protein